MRTAVREPLAASERDPSAPSAEILAALAISRATLHALAALSQVAQTAAEAALEEEADRIRRDRAPLRTLDLVEETRARLQAAPAEARMARALQRALVDAAGALPGRRVA